MNRQVITPDLFFHYDEADPLYRHQHGSSNKHPEKGATAEMIANETEDGIEESNDMSKPTDHELRYRKHFQTFPQKLHLILSTDGHDDVISWLEDGKSWRVHNKQRFIDEVMPDYFESAKWKSFLRQVNGWGFKRNKHGLTMSLKGSYFLESFIRGRPDLASKIRRTKLISKRNICMNAMLMPKVNNMSQPHLNAYDLSYSSPFYPCINGTNSMNRKAALNIPTGFYTQSSPGCSGHDITLDHDLLKSKSFVSNRSMGCAMFFPPKLKEFPVAYGGCRNAFFASEHSHDSSALQRSTFNSFPLSHIDLCPINLDTNISSDEIVSIFNSFTKSTE